MAADAFARQNAKLQFSGFAKAMQAEVILCGWKSHSVGNRPNDFNPYPKRIQFVAAAFAEMIVVVMPFQVVKADPDSFLIFCYAQLERLAGGATLGGLAGVRLVEYGIGIRSILRESEWT